MSAETEAGTAVGLGIVQGLTEFLPVSSSGHLVVFQQQLAERGIHLSTDHVAFDLVLHVGTLVPVVIVYRADILNLLKGFIGDNAEGRKMIFMLIVATLPTAIIGFVFEDWFMQVFQTTELVGAAFLFTAALLFSTKFVSKGEVGISNMPWKWAVLIGLAQGLAITPGISRSGSTIAMAMLLGLNRELAAKFSFLLSIPIILGAFALKAKDIESTGSILPLVLGFIAAALSGYFALKVLLRIVNAGDFSKFSYYLVVIAVLALFVL